MARKSLRIGTRSSALALTQARWVAGQLGEHGVEVELVEIATSGDQNQHAPLEGLGTVGVFTKEIQRALLAEEVDLAVHSLKDLPTVPTEGLALAAVPPRENPADAFVCSSCDNLASLPQGACVGTGSHRRRAQLLHARRDLNVTHLRGNVDTRLRKLDAGECDAILLAAAGLLRLGLESRIASLLTVEEMVPAVGQGALGLEIRADDLQTRARVEPLDHPETHHAIAAERALLGALRAGCQAPVGAWCRVCDDALVLTAVVLDRTGEHRIDISDRGEVDESTALGQRVAEALLSRGAAELIVASREAT